MSSGKKVVLIADDEIEDVSILEKKLSEAGYETCVARDGYSALSKARVVMPDLILLDVMLRGMHGLEVKNRLNQEEATTNIPVIFLTDHATTDDKVKGFQLKADDYVTKPFDFIELVARIDSIASKRQKYEQIFMTDALTGLNNVHVFKKNFSAFFNVARRYNRMFSIAVIDVDNFKPINDHYGHQAGDLVLKAIADTMGQIFREPDIIIRYGGDEFVVLFPETDQKQAIEATNRFRAKVESSKVFVNEGKAFITPQVSIGVASFHPDLKKESELFELADQNMYEDKKRRKQLALDNKTPVLVEKSLKSVKKKQ